VLDQREPGKQCKVSSAAGHDPVKDRGRWHYADAHPARARVDLLHTRDKRERARARTMSGVDARKRR
jgi:hypothetical protein